MGVINKQCFALLPQVNFPANNLNFHWSWRWWDRIQVIFLNLFYFNWRNFGSVYVIFFYLHVQPIKWIFLVRETLSRNSGVIWYFPTTLNGCQQKLECCPPSQQVAHLFGTLLCGDVNLIFPVYSVQSIKNWDHSQFE